MRRWPFGEKLNASVDTLVWPIANLPTWWGAGSVEGGTGAGSIAGATGLSLVEGPFQLPPPLDAAVLLTEILEDLLCRRNRPTFLVIQTPNATKSHRNIDAEVGMKM